MNNLIVQVKTDYIYKDIVQDFETGFLKIISNFELILNTIWTNERWIWWTHNERNCWIKRKIYSYLRDNNDEDKKAKDTKWCVIKRKFKFDWAIYKKIKIHIQAILKKIKKNS